ncbi:MAG: hypothetical protein MGF17_15195, partial [Trichodesmium sp. MAG_R04]|nr:hypothetical protein [Trichodesmium sp. MAG_R04]
MTSSITNFLQDYQKVENAYSVGNYEEAAALVYNLIQDYPEDPSSRLLCGHIYCYGLHQYDVAKEQYQLVLELSDDQDLINYAQQGINDSEQFITDSPVFYNNFGEMLDNNNIDDHKKEESTEGQVSSNSEALGNQNSLELDGKDLENVSDLELLLDENSLELDTQDLENVSELLLDENSLELDTQDLGNVSELLLDENSLELDTQDLENVSELLLDENSLELDTQDLENVSELLLDENSLELDTQGLENVSELLLDENSLVLTAENSEEKFDVSELEENIDDLEFIDQDDNLFKTNGNIDNQKDKDSKYIEDLSELTEFEDYLPIDDKKLMNELPIENGKASLNQIDEKLQHDSFLNRKNSEAIKEISDFSLTADLDEIWQEQHKKLSKEEEILENQTVEYEDIKDKKNNISLGKDS